MRGLANGNQAWGEWWEVGTASDVPNYGNWSLSLDSSGHNFTGTWTYGSQTAVAGTWAEQRLSYKRPSDTECFASDSGAGNLPLDGELVVAGSGGTRYHDCATSTTLEGSYRYVYSDGSLVMGYQDARCYTPTIAGPGPSVCTGMWSEPGFSGSFMNVRHSALSTYDTWWAGTTADIDYATQHNDTDSHNVEVVDKVGVASPPACSNYSSMCVPRVQLRRPVLPL